MKNCIVCSNSIEEHRNVCELCDSTKRVPSECPKCKALQTSEPLVGKTAAFAGRIRECTKCNFNFFIPKGLSEAIYGSARGSLPSSKLNCLDLEWLLFGLWNYQYEQFGGSTPAIDCDKPGLKAFDKSSSVPRKLWESFYWPPYDVEADDREKFLDLLAKYESPQLWYADYTPDYEQNLLSIFVSPAFEIAAIADDQVRGGLLYLIENNLDCTEAWLVKVVKNMLTTVGYFNT